MKIKAKLNFGIGLLLVLILLLSFFTVRQIKYLARASENIIKDNKETIVYTKIMLEKLTETDTGIVDLSEFASILEKQKSNITEKGEKELTETLIYQFSLYKRNPQDKHILIKMQATLFEIMNINLKAIEHKNNIAKRAAFKSIIIITVLGIFCIVIALILFLRLPSSISNPVKELNARFKQIALNDFSHRATFVGNNEFGELAVSFNSMADKLEEYHKSNIAKLLAEKKITETLLKTIEYPIIGLDKNFKITLINDSFRKIAGLKELDFIGRNLLEIAPQNEVLQKLIIMEVKKTDDTENIKNNPKIIIDVDGKDHYFEKEIHELSYLVKNKKQFLGFVIILKNITKYMELDLAKTNFIATVSHEFKTPISSMKLSLQLLSNEQIGMLNAEQKDLIESLKDDTNRLLGITAELMNISQVESGNIQLSLLPSDVHDIIDYALKATHSEARKKNITIVTDCSDEIPYVIVDKDKTAWVLTNLILNAIRYSPENSEITVSVENCPGKVEITVTDKGQGIEPQFIDKIFDRYFRIPGTNKEGTGLGLAISKEFLVAQGGEIFVKSTLNVGSSFTIVLDASSQ